MRMNVFLSWSGERSRMVAEALRDWLPCVLQAVKPFMSARDIEKGAAWPNELLANLSDARFGIVCLTPENLTAPWLLFEAGAIAKAVNSPAYLCTYLLDFSPTDLEPPLSQFQATVADQTDTKKLMETANRRLGDLALPQSTFDSVYSSLWPQLQERLQDVPRLAPTPPRRPDRELLEETLSTVRQLAREEQRRRITRVFRGETLLPGPRRVRPNSLAEALGVSQPSPDVEVVNEEPPEDE
jgi:hypothetical protein